MGGGAAGRRGGAGRAGEHAPLPPPLVPSPLSSPPPLHPLSALLSPQRQIPPPSPPSHLGTRQEAEVCAPSKGVQVGPGPLASEQALRRPRRWRVAPRGATHSIHGHAQGHQAGNKLPGYAPKPHHQGPFAGQGAPWRRAQAAAGQAGRALGRPAQHGQGQEEGHFRARYRIERVGGRDVGDGDASGRRGPGVHAFQADAVLQHLAQPARAASRQGGGVQPGHKRDHQVKGGQQAGRSVAVALHDLTRVGGLGGWALRNEEAGDLSRLTQG